MENDHGSSLLVFLVLLGTLVWMSLTFTSELNQFQVTLNTTIDSLLKASAGVIFGLVSGKSLP